MSYGCLGHVVHAVDLGWYAHLAGPLSELSWTQL